MAVVTLPRQVYYFGCRRNESGHHWHSHIADDRSFISGPGGWESAGREVHIDGGYAPKLDPRTRAAQGRATHTFINGWTVVAYWDQSGDGREGGNSAFVARGVYSFDEMMQVAREQFPWVFERQKFEVVQFNQRFK